MKLIREESGQAIAEFAVLLPVFAFVAFAIVDIQWMTKQAANIDYIANEVARCDGIAFTNRNVFDGTLPSMPCTPTSTTGTSDSPQSYAAFLARNLRLSDGGLTVTIPEPPCSESTRQCTVFIQYNYKPLGAWFPAMTISRRGFASFYPPPSP